MNNKEAYDILMDECARFEEIKIKYGVLNDEDARKYRAALAIAMHYLKNANLTVPIILKHKNKVGDETYDRCVQAFMDKSRHLIFDRFMTTDFAEMANYEWEEIK